MKLRKIFLLATSLLAISSANLCNFAMESDSPSLPIINSTTKTNALLGTNTVKVHLLRIVTPEGAEIYEILDPYNGTRVECALCQEPLLSNQSLSISKCRNLVPNKNRTLQNAFDNSICQLLHTECLNEQIKYDQSHHKAHRCLFCHRRISKGLKGYYSLSFRT